MSTRQSEILRARSEAARTHADLGIDPHQPIDVFSAIRKAGLWVVFNEFDNLLGAMSREGVGGIMVNSARSYGLQRFTAAHELGHWILHSGDVVWDTDEEMMKGNTLQEVAAQEFAAAFLMPRHLVNRTLRELGVPYRGKVDAPAAYALARNLGASYEAALVQLQRIGAITWDERHGLAAKTPGKIKSELVGGRKVDRFAQVWTPSLVEIGSLRVTVGDEISVTLPENRTTGYRWDASQTTPEFPLLSDEFIRPTNDLIGAGGTRKLVFRAETHGLREQPLPLRRRSQTASPPAQVITLRANVQLTPERANAHLLVTGGGHAH